MSILDVLMPRPKRPRRADKAVKIEQALANKAKIIANTRGITIAEYLSDILRSPIEKDWPKALKTLNQQDQQGGQE